MKKALSSPTDKEKSIATLALLCGVYGFVCLQEHDKNIICCLMQNSFHNRFHNRFASQSTLFNWQILSIIKSALL